MKKFSISTKNVEEDFIETKDVWLSISEAKRGYSFFVTSNEKELFLALNKRIEEEEKRSGEPTLLFNSYKSDCKILVNSFQRKLKIQSITPPFSIMCDYEEKKILPLKDGFFDYKLGDFVVGFDSEFDTESEIELKNFIFSISSYDGLFLRELLDFLVINQKSMRPLFVINFSECTFYKFSMASNMKSLISTIDMLRNKISKYNCDKLWQIETVLHEAFVNAITHGNELEPKKTVDIFYELGKNGFRILIRDMGKGFDVNNLFIPVGKEAIDAISGRGVYLMQKLSDVIFYSPEGNKVSIFFNF